jgi:hypothetical protein
MNWSEASPDLTVRPKEENKENNKEKEPPVSPRNQVITALSLSPVSANVMWAGTGDGLIQLTRDGGANWQNVSMPGLDARSSVSIIDASHFDAGAAYAAVDKFHDSHALFYRTHDYGKTWQAISTGFPDYGIARVIREDTERKGLLYAGTENGVFVSFDDGDHWQSLQLNLPTCDVRDLIVHGDDLAIATYGRSLWILDDVNPLRQAGEQAASADTFLYRPQTAIRLRWNNDQDTPLPPEVPAGQNPPDGAFIDYYLKSAPQGDITLTISNSQGNVIRKYSSAEPGPTKLKPEDVPEYWFAPPTVLSKNAGMNRFVWNLRYPHPANLSYALFNESEKSVAFYGTEDAVPGVTPRFQPLGPQVVPGDYELALTVNGQTYRQTLHVIRDPRVHISQYDYVAQFDLLRQATAGMSTSYDAFGALAPVQHALADRLKSFQANAQAKDDVKVLEDFNKKFGAIQDGTFTSPGFGGANSELTQIIYVEDTGDGRPSESVRASVTQACQAITKSFEAWRKFNADDVPALNTLLQKYKLAALPSAELNAPASVCGR